MAEIVGLALGAVALVGVFKDCIDLFSMISSVKSLGRDYEVLDVKLDVEKTLLLQWAERVRLAKTPYDSRLDDPVIHGTIARVLATIQLLLSESRDLENRYGLRPLDDQDTLVEGPSISGDRLRRFHQEFAALSLRQNALRQSMSKGRQIRWVIRDKDKFDKLILELSYFISKLNDVVPIAAATYKGLVNEDLAQQTSLRTLFLVRDASRGRREAVAELAQQAIQQRILQTLWFRKMDERKGDIKMPHCKTLDWALNPPQQDVAWDSLSHWLQSGTGIYWLSGKAGSGKSTLMKYIHCHRRTEEMLNEWARGATLTTAAFFLWHLGVQEQKSQAGLSRALLYQVLRARMELIQAVLPNMWSEAQVSDDGILTLPSLAEMRTAFATLSDIGTASSKYCLFVDGLDEYYGNLRIGLDFLKMLSSCPNIKVVVSSRPLSTLVDAFSGMPTLKLQDLTKADIATYISDKLGSHPYMSDLRETNSPDAEKILDDVAAKASGVFLWVVLACNSLQDGFAAFDRVSDLQKRVDELPPELEDLFQHILKKIEPRYQQQAAKLLRIQHARQVVEDAEDLSSFGLAILDENEFDLYRPPDFRKICKKAKRDKCRMLEGRLRSRCCGLLEIH